MRNHLVQFSRHPKGAALLLVMVMAALFMVIVLTMLSLTRSELRSSDLYVSTVRTDQLADITQSAVITQIRKATEFNAGEGMSFATQPGAIRRYTANGDFFGGHKLYSDRRMDVPGSDGEESLAGDAPPEDWNEMPAHYVDLNEPVVRTGTDGRLRTFFPIMDPRAAFDDPETPLKDESVEGFSFAGELGGLVNEGEADQWRVPMPVEWLYVLEDGTLGTLDENNQFSPADRVSETNDIVGRIAFWTDDESCKININTASEPTHWAIPSLSDRVDWGWAKIQPGTGEYQRFPGHPATTALSPVLFPNQQFADPPSPNKDGEISLGELRLARRSAAEKGKIYDWAPKIQDIGSKSGTAFMHYEQTRRLWGWNLEKTYSYEHQFSREEAARERLYASVDEYLLDPDRLEHDFSFTNYSDGQTASGWDRWVNEDTLNRSRAFLTAHSRAPETTVFGTPRIAMWPLHVNSDPNAGYQTHFDRLIARCSTLGSIDEGTSGNDNSYFFRREKSQDSTHDISLSRNRELLRYLQALTSRPVPGYGASFAEKYGEDRDQILVEMFDYIRSTNLFDPILSAQARAQGEGVQPKTYTAGRIDRNHRGTRYSDYRDHESYWKPGHGFVIPSHSEEWDATGLGRTITLSEVAMHFICCADGTPDEKNPYKDNPLIAHPWKGGPTGFEYKYENDETVPGRYGGREIRFKVYPNFPPNPEGNPYGPRDSGHPGYKEENWNRCLEDNTPLEVGKKRIQGMLHLDFFNIAPGYTPVSARVGARIKGLKNFVLNEQPLFPDDEAEMWRMGFGPNAHWSVRDGLGVGWGSGYMGQRVVGRHPMPQDGDQRHTNGRIRNEPDERLRFNELVTNFIDVDEDSMTFGANGPIEIELLVQQEINGPIKVLQTIVVEFPGPDSMPSPNMVLDEGKGYRSNSELWDDFLPPPSGWDEDANGKWGKYFARTNQTRKYWTFYRDGFNLKANGIESRGGRMGILRWIGHNWVYGSQQDVVYSMVPWHGDFRLLAGVPHVDRDPKSPTGRTFVPTRGVPSLSGGVPHFGYHSFEHHIYRQYNNSLSHGVWHHWGRKEFRTEHQLANLPWPGHNHRSQRTPQFPKTAEATAVSQRYGDFDIGFGGLQGGAFINKPDGGNLISTEKGTEEGLKLDLTIDDDANEVEIAYMERRLKDFFLRIPYFHGGYQESGSAHFSPNRMVSSPVMMGSLPTGVKAQDPWRTLLFRPDINSVDTNGSPTTHPGAKSPPDHLLLDLFWMPVVEPYAISEPFSTAGKINLNYQILPFPHIRRATGVHGLLKSERIPSLPIGGRDGGLGPHRDRNFERLMYDNAANRRTYEETHWHHRWRGKWLYRNIDADETLEDFDKKFHEDFTLFRSASQICEMHLVPDVMEMPPGVRFTEGEFSDTDLDTETRMKAYWKTHRATSDNLRERPYANIYGRATTQTNTWRIHYRVQRLKKSRESTPGSFNLETDSVGAEQRGETLIERYIDPNDPDLPDFTRNSQQNLDKFYRFRVLNTKRFAL